MSEIMWIRSHVERLLQAEWHLSDIGVDEDGDYPFRSGTAAGWVQVMDTAPTMVRVFAHAAIGMKPTLKLLRELNDIEARTLSATVRIERGVVVVSQTFSPIGLTQPVLAQALQSVAGVANDIGTLLGSLFDGSTPYVAEPATTQDAA